MNGKPILFSSEMVRAILEGRKTQTRRVVKGEALNWLQPGMFSREFVASNQNFMSPYGYEFDLLWVREKWNAQTQSGKWWHEVKRDDRPLLNWAWTNPVQPAFEAIPPRWLPSIHMPREASRITLEIVSLRIEKLQDMSEVDAIAEGVGVWHQANLLGHPKREEEWCKWTRITAEQKNLPVPSTASNLGAFAMLWNSINEVRGFDWRSNPWVWVIEFFPVKETL